MVSQTGRIVSGSILTLEKIYEVKDEASVGFLVKQGKQASVQALYLCALKECWGLCENIFTADSITSTVLLLISEYPELRPQEIVLILKNGLAGKYGKCYGKVTTMEIMRWALEYYQERLVFFENKLTKKDRNFSDIEPKILNNFKSIPKKELSAQEKEMEEIRKESERKSNEKYQIWIKEFDELCRKENNNSVMKFITINNKKMNVEEYLKYKLKNL